MAGGYTFNTTRYLKDRANGGAPFRTFTPRHIFQLWTTYQLPGPWNRWSVGGGVNVKSGISGKRGAGPVRGSATRFAAATVWNARIGYRVDEHISLALNVNNLFDGSLPAPGQRRHGQCLCEPRSSC